MSGDVSYATGSATRCVNVLILCLEWLRANDPDAVVTAEVEPDIFEDVALVSAAEAALESFRAEHVRPGGEPT